MADKAKEKSRRANHPGSLIVGSNKKNQSMRRTRRKQGRPEGSLKE